ncbi:DinB family protein [Reichenbachiella ulvae]|nr:DUF1572 family protein [Reichenbachiella ulvae]
MSGMLTSFEALFNTDLDRLKTELESYESDAQLWKIEGTIGNSGGTLIVHLCGNLQHFFGAVMGGSDYQRDRDGEFSKKDVSKSELLEEIEKSRQAVKNGLQALSEDMLESNFPLEVFGHPMTYGYFLIRLQGHLNYHLGQINYHRRLIKG